MATIGWETVLASGAFSAVVGGGIGLAGQRWQRRYEREESMRGRMIEAADTYVQAIAEAIAVTVRRYENPGEVADAQDELNRLRKVAIVRSRRIALLFGATSSVNLAARALHDSLTALGGAVGALAANLTDSTLRDALDASVEETSRSTDRFVDAARAKITSGPETQNEGRPRRGMP